MYAIHVEIIDSSLKQIKGSTWRETLTLNSECDLKVTLRIYSAVSPFFGGRLNSYTPAFHHYNPPLLLRHCGLFRQ